MENLICIKMENLRARLNQEFDYHFSDGQVFDWLYHHGFRTTADGDWYPEDANCMSSLIENEYTFVKQERSGSGQPMDFRRFSLNVAPKTATEVDGIMVPEFMIGNGKDVLRRIRRIVRSAVASESWIEVTSKSKLVPIAEAGGDVLLKRPVGHLGTNDVHAYHIIPTLIDSCRLDDRVEWFRKLFRMVRDGMRYLWFSLGYLADDVALIRAPVTDEERRACFSTIAGLLVQHWDNLMLLDRYFVSDVPLSRGWPIWSMRPLGTLLEMGMTNAEFDQLIRQGPDACGRALRRWTASEITGTGEENGSPLND